MKKILAFLLAATMLCALFVLPSTADDKINFELEIPYVNKAPTIDGKVGAKEYAKSLPLHTYSESKEQFDDTTNNEFTDWDFDFHMAWDADNLYMAWVVKSDIHGYFPVDTYDSDSWMWQHSCVQFIFTPGAPDASQKVFQTAEWSGNYLEVGLCLTTEGEQIRVAWSKPVGAEALDVNDWDAVIVRDDSAKTTVYEVRIPWGKSGLKEVGNGAQFGLTYAVAAQEDYNTKKGMIEWQDAILGGKNADNAAIITLTGNEEIVKSEVSAEYSQTSTPDLEDGKLPGDVTDATVKLGLDSVDTTVIGESAILFTAADKMDNTKWAHCLLLEPTSGSNYKIVEAKTGAGENITFDTEFKKGMLVAAFHSDGAEGSTGKERREAAMALQVGAELTLFGVNLTDGALQYKNAMLYYNAPAGGDESGEVSGDDSSAVVEDSSAVVEDSSEVVDDSSAVADESSETEESDTASANDSSVDDGDDEGGSLTWLWIVLGVVGVAAIAVVVVIVLKKKKA